MRGIWFGLATASFMAVAYINVDATSALVIFGIACSLGLMHEVINS